MSKVFIYVVNRKVPSQKVAGKWDTFEEVSIKSKIIPKLYDSASFVLNVLEQKIEKNRFGHNSDKEYTFETVIAYLSKNHSSVRELMQSYTDIMDAYNKAIENFEQQQQVNNETEQQEREVNPN